MISNSQNIQILKDQQQPILSKYLQNQVLQFQIFSKNECDNICQQFDNQQLQQSKLSEKHNEPLINLDIGILLNTQKHYTMIQSIILKVIPLVKQNFPFLCKSGVDNQDFIGFYLNYTKDQNHIDLHNDYSLITLNICLRKPTTGGNILFTYLNQTDIEIQIKQGFCLIHPGNLLHKTQAFSGEIQKTSLIIYCLAGHHKVPVNLFNNKYLPYIAMKYNQNKNMNFEIPNLPNCCQNLLNQHNKAKFSLSNNILKIVFSFLINKELAFYQLISTRWYKLIRSLPYTQMIKPNRYETKQKYQNWKNIQQEQNVIKNQSQQEIIGLHIGGAGIRVGHEFWKYVTNNSGLCKQFPSKLYEEIQLNNKEQIYSPRAIFIDNNFEEIDNRNLKANNLGYVNQLFNSQYNANYMVEESQDDSIKLQYTEDIIRKALESCNNLDGFFMTSSMEGNFGSKATCQIISLLKDNFQAKNIVNQVILPNGIQNTFQTSIQQKYNYSPYNALQLADCMLEKSTLIFPFSNEYIDIFLRKNKFEYPMIPEFNKIIANELVQITHTLRQQDTFTDMCQNMIAFPVIKTLTSNTSPYIFDINKQSQQIKNMSVPEITIDSMSGNFAGVNDKYGKYLSVCLYYHGNCVSKDVMAAIATMKTRRDIQFVEWIPTGFKAFLTCDHSVFPKDYGILNQERSCCKISNNTSVSEIYKKINQDFRKLIKKKAYFQSYDEFELSEQIYNLDTIIQEYEEINIDSVEEGEEEELEY